MLPDYLQEHLDVVFVGTSVATASAKRRHYYAGPGNRFWEFLWEAGFTGDRLLIPEQDSMVLQYGVGLTDLVKKVAASSDSRLRAPDYDVKGFIEKILGANPFCVAFNGSTAAGKVAKGLGKGIAGLGLARWKVGDSTAYVLPSSSASSADPRHYAPKSSKLEWWAEFGEWLRTARGEV